MKTAIFGPAGNSRSFTGSTLNVPDYIEAMGLDAYEYQCGRGVRIKAEKAGAFGALAASKGITLSLHAPYYISLSSLKEETRLGSIRYVLESAAAMHAMGGGEIVLHSGSCTGQTREQATALAKDTLKRCLDALDSEGYTDITLCPETMGKINQLGTLEEVLELCSVDERLIPCIDFGHLNARTLGSIKTSEDYEAIFDAMEDSLGRERAARFHSHFSKIEYTAGGEKRHLTFEDQLFGPDPIPMLRLVARRGYTPMIICESDGTQAEDAALMKKIYHEFLKEM